MVLFFIGLVCGILIAPIVISFIYFIIGKY